MKQGRAVEDNPGIIAADTDSALGEIVGENGARITPLPMVYSIRSGDNRIGSFILHKGAFCAGDVVLGNFDFSNASTKCLQVISKHVYCYCYCCYVLMKIKNYSQTLHVRIYSRNCLRASVRCIFVFVTFLLLRFCLH